MGDEGRDRSPELDQVRELLFPNLPPDEGWARIDAAISRAADPARTEGIERRAQDDLYAALLAALWRLKEERGE